MSVTEQWLPIENAHEQRLVERLARLSLKGDQGPSFNLSSAQPLAQRHCPYADLARGALISCTHAAETFEEPLRDD